jgi:hypothetical protein
VRTRWSDEAAESRHEGIARVRRVADRCDHRNGGKRRPRAAGLPVLLSPRDRDKDRRTGAGGRLVAPRRHPGLSRRGTAVSRAAAGLDAQRRIARRDGERPGQSVIVPGE